MTEGATYVVTDIEANGPYPSENAMLSLGAVAVSDTLKIVTTFSINLTPTIGSTPNLRTLAWFQREAHEAYTRMQQNAIRPEQAIASFVEWVLVLPKPRIFVAHPVIFDGIWIDAYLRAFSAYRLFDYATHAKPLFAGTGLDLSSLLMGATGMPFSECCRSELHPSWFSEHIHSHVALDDAMGYANLLINALRMARTGVARRFPILPQAGPLS